MDGGKKFSWSDKLAIGARVLEVARSVAALARPEQRLRISTATLSKMARGPEDARTIAFGRLFCVSVEVDETIPEGWALTVEAGGAGNWRPISMSCVRFMYEEE